MEKCLCSDCKNFNDCAFFKNGNVKIVKIADNKDSDAINLWKEVMSSDDIEDLTSWFESQKNTDRVHAIIGVYVKQ